MQISIPSHFPTTRTSVLRLIAICLFGTVVGTCRIAAGQSDQAEAGHPPQPDVQESPEPGLRGWVSSFGSLTYVPQKWGQLHVHLLNSLDEAREVVCVTYFDEQPQLQFGRRIWLPARAQTQMTHPVWIPQPDDPKARAMKFHSLILENRSGTEVLVDRGADQFLQTGTIQITPESRTTAVIGKVVDKKLRPPNEVIDLIAGARGCQNLSQKVTTIADHFLPADEMSLNCFEHIVIAEERIGNDRAALTALRHWLNSGGHLWIMLDRVDMWTVEALLGDDFRGSLVDRVELNQVRVDQAHRSKNSSEGIGDRYEFERPVHMARVVVPDMDVLYTVNDWPAALTRRCGDGHLLITTVGARGWLKVPDASSPRIPDARTTPSGVPITPMVALAMPFFGRKQAKLFPPKAIEPQVREYIGYTIPSWNLIVGILVGFSTVLLVTGAILWRQGRLEHLGWIGSMIAIAVSVLLLTIGRSFRHSVSEAIASVQLAQAVVGTDDVQTDGTIAVYHPEGSDSQIRTKRGGMMMPEMTGIESSTRRMVTTDYGEWHWENLAQPAGLRISAFSRSDTVPDRIETHVTFNANGLVGKYSGRLPPGADAMIATREGRLGVKFEGDGSFIVVAEDLFEKDQLLSARLLGDEQTRRRRTLEKLFNNSDRRDFPYRPQLMFWSDQWDNGFEFAEQVTSRNSTLVCVPLIIQRPDTGTDIFIPSPLLPYRNRLQVDGKALSSMWDYGRHEWQERADPSSAWLEFQVPRELVPLSARRAKIVIAVSGPVGLIEIRGLKNGSVATVKKIVDPVGSVSIDVDDPDLLSIHSNGTLALEIVAGDPSRPELTRTKSTSANANGDEIAKVNYWRINSLALQVWARTDEPAGQE